MKAPYNIRQRFLTPKIVASELSLTYQKTLDLIRTGKLPAYKFGRDYRIERGELERYLQKTKSINPSIKVIIHIPTKNPTQINYLMKSLKN